MKCHAGRYLLGNQCLDVCPTTHYGVDESRTCEPCESPCETCLDSPNFCLSCDKTTDWYLFFRNQCHMECPEHISIFDESECKECSTNCKTCVDDTIKCSSCDDGLYLDLLNYRCVETCPIELTVATTLSEADVGPLK